MGLIINKQIRQLMKGYPTVSDKYNVAGGILSGDTPVEFGQLVQKGDTAGYFKAITATDTIDAVTKLGGFVLATNVKLATEWPGTTVQVIPGEAFNLLINGFMAVELAATAKTADITMNAEVKVLANGGITTSTDDAALGVIPNTVFTGVYETINNVTYAEIYVK